MVEDGIENQRSMGLTQEADEVLWRQKGDNYKPIFNSKMTWNLLRAETPTKEWWKGIWFAYATPKYSFHSWLAFHNRLSTGDRMLKWNIGVDGSCVLYQSTLETRNHLYFMCRYSNEVWKMLIRNVLVSTYSADWDINVEVLLDTSQDKTRLFLLRYAFQITLHSIWRERNNRRYGETPNMAPQLAQTIDKQIRNRLSSIKEMGDTRYEDGLEMWFASR